MDSKRWHADARRERVCAADRRPAPLPARADQPRRRADGRREDVTLDGAPRRDARDTGRAGRVCAPAARGRSRVCGAGVMGAEREH